MRGQPIDALYRFYPIERLYRHAVFADLFDAVPRGGCCCSTACAGFSPNRRRAWRGCGRIGTRSARAARAAIERHVPPTLLARDPAALDLLPEAVVKHVNGREGDSVVFGRSLDAAAWEARLLETGYVVQRAIAPVPVQDVAIDEWRRELSVIEPRYACVGAFVIGGRFGGCYTRLDGPVTSARATYAATLVGPPALAAAAGVRGHRAE